MTDLAEKIIQIQQELRKTPYHKGTEHYIGLLRAKLAKLRFQLQESTAKKGAGGGFAIPKEGDATCVLVGVPSVGKSTILSKLTAAKPKIAPYPFTTLSVIPGMMKYRGAAIQILDVPGLVGKAAKGAGHGREILSVVRIADLLVILAEANKFEFQKDLILAELAENGIRVNKPKPEITVKKLNSGGMKIITISNCGLEKKQIVLTAEELGLVNAEIQIKSKVTVNDLIDAILGNRIYLPALFIASKVDLTPILKLKNEAIPVSALKNLGIGKLKEEIWQKLGLIKVYLKPANGKTDFNNPLILKYGSKVSEAASKVSSDLAQNFKSAQILRGGLKKQVGANFELEDEDAVTFLT